MIKKYQLMKCYNNSIQKIMKTKKVLVTGGNGFIGSHIVDLLLKKEYQIVVISKVTPSRFVNSRSNISHYRIDLSSFEEVENVLRVERPGVICHLASSIPYARESLLHPEKSLQDVIHAINLFEAARKFDVSHIIFSSSSNVYEDINGPLREDSKKNPLSPLGISKIMVESYIKYLQNTTDIIFTTLRYFNAFGPRQRLSEFSGIIPNAIVKAMKGEEITIFGNGNQIRDFIYVDDIARANLKVIEHPQSGIFNVGSGQGTSVKKLIATIEKLIARKMPKIYSESSNEITNSIADISKMKKTFNWKPRVSIEQGLKKTIDYYKGISL